MAAAKKLGDPVQQPISSTQTMPDSKAASTQHADQGSHRHFTEAPAQSSQKHRQKCDQSSCSDKRLQQVWNNSPPGVEGGSTAAAHAELNPELALTAQGQQAQQGTPESDSRTASSTHPADTAQSLLHFTPGRRRDSSDVPASRVWNAVAELSQQPSLANSEITTPAGSDEFCNRNVVKGSRRKRKDSRPHKPGPPAFPQLPYERSLQQQQSEGDAASHCTDCEHQTGLASESARQTCAQTDMLADAMQRQLQLRERRAEGALGEGQEGPQQRLSQHGGYMQRGYQERLPRRRTTRSMLRGADTQTGKSSNGNRCNASHCLELRPLMVGVFLFMLGTSRLLQKDKAFACSASQQGCKQCTNANALFAH